MSAAFNEHSQGDEFQTRNLNDSITAFRLNRPVRFVGIDPSVDAIPVVPQSLAKSLLDESDLGMRIDSWKCD
jgi:hypothetical protein